MEEKVTTWYLEMLSKHDLKPKFIADDNLKIEEVKVKDFRYNRFLYSLVGEQWWWTEKLKWSDEEWIAFAEDENLKTFVAYYSGTPAGYYEILKEPVGSVKIVYFGLSPKFIGKGIGGHLLTHSIQTAWNQNPNRVWVHTCSQDHPSALKNYQARGFKIYETKLQ